MFLRDSLPFRRKLGVCAAEFKEVVAASFIFNHIRSWMPQKPLIGLKLSMVYSVQRIALEGGMALLDVSLISKSVWPMRFPESRSVLAETSSAASKEVRSRARQTSKRWQGIRSVMQPPAQTVSVS